jgi:hypothetical protein
MRRRTFDILVSWGGVLATAVLLVAGSLLLVGYNFANSSVTDQLAEQNIYFPPAGEAIADPRIEPYLAPYAGQQLLTGEQAEVYANHYIAVHLEDTAGGKSYAEVSALQREDPENEELIAQKDTLFRGETLRGLLLNAYAFWKFGQIALWAAIGAFAAAAIMGALSALGFVHARRVSPEVEVAATKVLVTDEQPEPAVETVR